MNLLIKILQLLMTKKSYWLYPILVIFVIFCAVMIYSQGEHVPPWIYTLF